MRLYCLIVFNEWGDLGSNDVCIIEMIYFGYLIMVKTKVYFSQI